MHHKKWSGERGSVLLFIAVALLLLFLIGGPTMCSINQGQKEANEKLGEISTRITRIEAEQTRQGQQLDLIWGAVQFLRNLELVKIAGGFLAIVGLWALFGRR